MASTRDEHLLALLNAAEDELSTAKVIHNRQEQDAALHQVSELLTELRTALLDSSLANNKPTSNKENKHDN